jgi:pimeloyl-ACP methyl ester carboxylesterase
LSPAGSQLSPHSAERVTLHADVAALRASPPEPQATVLLIPGYTGSKEDFAPLLDACAAAGFDTVAIDLPGQYESPGPDEPDAYRPEPLGALVAELAAELAVNRPLIVLGHSYGGLVARAAVLAGAPAAGLTLVCSGPAKLPDGARMDALDQGERLLRAGGTAAAYRVREAWNARDPGWAAVPQPLKEFLRTRFVASSPAGLLGMAAGLREEPDRVVDLAAAGVPCLVVAGQWDDAWSVPEQREMARRLQAPFALIPGAAHSPNTENPAGLLDVLLPAWLGWLR